jgi:hypothetical protein
MTMKNMIKVLAVAALLGAATLPAKAQTYTKQVLVPPSQTLTNAQTLNYVDTTGQTNAGLATVASGTNIWFKIPDGKPVSIKIVQVSATTTAANVTYTLATSNDEFPSSATTWANLNTISFTAPLASTTVQVLNTNIAASVFGGARSCILRSVQNGHTQSITFHVTVGHY